ncbi:MAG: hypothetical protein ACLPKB_21445 [Xanthobacteraceae bacterium]
MAIPFEFGSAPENVEPPRNPLRFIIGQDRKGHWIVRETHGLGGGIFVSREAALDYAEFETDHRPGAVRLAAQPLELEL